MTVAIGWGARERGWSLCFPGQVQKHVPEAASRVDTGPAVVAGLGLLLESVLPCTELQAVRIFPASTGLFLSFPTLVFVDFLKYCPFTHGGESACVSLFFCASHPGGQTCFWKHF